jgi:sterol desaturase/sphingolipid hydroxylase (fatty acid hydroxylase superfamily)
METLFNDLGQIWLGNLEMDLRRYVVFATAVWLVLWVALRLPLRGRKIRDASPPSSQLAAEFFFSVRSIAVFSTVGLAMTALDRMGAYPLQEVAQSWGPAWFWASLALMILAQDAYIYWVHRWMHHPRWFRVFHRRHHKSNNPSPFTAYSFDLGEAFLMVLFVVVWPLIMPTPWGVIDLFMLHQIFRNTLVHAGYELMPARADGRPLFDWLVTTVHHDLHHGQAGYNYGAWFTWWDRWCGTEHPDYHARFAEVARRPYWTRRQVQPAGA